MSGTSKILVISGSEEARSSLALIAKEYGFESVSVSDGTEVRPVIQNGSFDLIIINTPLASEFGLDVAMFASKNTDSAIIITAAQKNCEEINRKIGGIGAYILPRPLNKSIIMQTMRFVMTARSKVLDLEAERVKLEKKLRDQKQINRAKCVLVQYLRISEPEAHRMIQKRAMDQRVPEIEIALDILKTYEM